MRDRMLSARFSFNEHDNVYNHREFSDHWH
jgi:hypothetical protein